MLLFNGKNAPHTMIFFGWDITRSQYVLKVATIVHAHLPSFCAMIFFTFQAQSRFKQAAIV